MLIPIFGYLITLLSYFLKSFNISYLLICVSVYMCIGIATVHAWRSGDNWQDSILGPENQTQSVNHDSKHLYH